MVKRGVGHKIYGVSKVHCNSSWQLHKPDITHLPTWWVLGGLFKEKETAPGGVEAKTSVRYSASSGGAGEREHRDVEIMKNTAFPLGLFLESLYSEFLHVAFICSLNNLPIL